MSLMVELDVDGLVAARRSLSRVIDHTDEALPDVIEADGLVERAIIEIDEEGGYEESLSQAIDLVDDAVEKLGDELQFVIEMHRAGRIRRSNDTVEAVVDELRTALGHIGEWADLARSELRSLR